MPEAWEVQVMQRALKEARRGRTSPNPRVGAAVVRDRNVVALGFHARAGEAHAEVDAMRKAGDARGATLFVTLEPCNHQGRTGPCTEALIAAGVQRVVIGCRDPLPHRPGAMERLQQAGIDVEVGVCEEACRALIADFEKHHSQGLPFVTLKAAVTLDGRVATRTGDSKWITGEAARSEAHRMRADSDAVLVGVGTMLADDPALSVRHVAGVSPLRVVLDSNLRLPAAAKMLHDDAAPVLIFHADDVDRTRVNALAQAGVECHALPREGAGVSLMDALQELGRRDVMRLLVEGGARVHGAFLDQGLADRAAIFVAPRIVGDAAALPLALGRGVDGIAGAWQLCSVEVERFDDDVLITGNLVHA